MFVIVSQKCLQNIRSALVSFREDHSVLWGFFLILRWEISEMTWRNQWFGRIKSVKWQTEISEMARQNQWNANQKRYAGPHFQWRSVVGVPFFIFYFPDSLILVCLSEFYAAVPRIREIAGGGGSASENRILRAPKLSVYSTGEVLPFSSPIGMRLL